MNEISKEEFSKIYKEQFLPILEPIERERSEIINKITPILYATIIFAIISVFGFITNNKFYTCAGCLVAVPGWLYMKNYWSIFQKNLKKEILVRVLSLFGDMHLSEDKNLISAEEIRNMRIFPHFQIKADDDVITGVHKDCDYIIDECELYHSHGNEGISDFKGLIIKIRMNKNFSGKTIVRESKYLLDLPGCEEVKLEDVEFMKDMKVFSTDQIEARYILTTAFIERLHALGTAFANKRDATTYRQDMSFKFSKKVQKAADSVGIRERKLVSAAFTDGYVYLFVPKYEDFFEVNKWYSLLNENNYYDIYCQLQLILSIIEYLKLDLKLGM